MRTKKLMDINYFLLTLKVKVTFHKDYFLSGTPKKKNIVIKNFLFYAGMSKGE